MKIGIIYYSKLGHSKKIAQAIAQELKVEAQDIRDHPELNAIDLLYIVSGIYGGRSAPELIEFIHALDNQHVKRASLLTSSGGESTKAMDARTALTEQAIQVSEDEFTCQGAILFVGMGHPNKKDIQNAIEFVRDTSQSLK
jgi:flavodoxin